MDVYCYILFIIIVFGSSVFPYCVTCRKPRHADITNRRGPAPDASMYPSMIVMSIIIFFLLQKITYSRTVHFVDFVSRNTTNKRTRPRTSIYNNNKRHPLYLAAVIYSWHYYNIVYNIYKYMFILCACDGHNII